MPVDDKLLELTKHYAGTLVTNDVYLKIKATIAGLQTHGYGGTEHYNGVKVWEVQLDEQGFNVDLEKVLTEKQPPEQFVLKENEYLIIKTIPDNLYQGVYVWRAGALQEVMYHEIRNKWIGKIKPRPRNPEQICLFDAVCNPDIQIVYASGQWGTGKSFILNNYALQELENGNINKIVYIPNNSYVANTIELGALPGEKTEKVAGSLGPLIDLIGIDEIHRLEDNGQLEIVPMGFARGRSFEKSIIIVNEAQNLTDEHIKLLLGRIGDGSRIFYDGDIKQADSQLFKNKSGLKLLLNLADSPVFGKIFSTVKLNKIERSLAAQSAGYLDELQGSI